MLVSLSQWEFLFIYILFDLLQHSQSFLWCLSWFNLFLYGLGLICSCKFARRKWIGYYVVKYRFFLCCTHLLSSIICPAAGKNVTVFLFVHRKFSIDFHQYMFCLIENNMFAISALDKGLSDSPNQVFIFIYFIWLIADTQTVCFPLSYINTCFV